MSDFVNTSETMGGDDAVFDALVAHELVELKDDTITSLGQYAFYGNIGLKIIELPNLKSLGTNVFRLCTGLTTASFQSLGALGAGMFQGCTSLETLNAPEITTLGNSCLEGCKNLDVSSFPNVVTINTRALAGVKSGVVSLPVCTTISSDIGSEDGPEGFDFAKKVSIGTSAFAGSYNLIHLVLRSNELCPLTVYNAFYRSPIDNRDGHIYVPAELVDTYKGASNWSDYASQILPISEYPKPVGSISDSWAQIFEAEQNGSYKTKYSIGDSKLVNIGGNDVLMRIAAIDTDVLASDASATAPITWISAGIVDTKMFNSSGTNCSWSSSTLRAYLRDTVFPNIQSDVRTNIKEVSKTYAQSYNSTSTNNDTVWIPSAREVFGDSAPVENSGPTYESFFAYYVIMGDGKYGFGTAVSWWLRSAVSGFGGTCVTSNGGYNQAYMNQQNGVVLGFCT